jgi:hypothetical protein
MLPWGLLLALLAGEEVPDLAGGAVLLLSQLLDEGPQARVERHTDLFASHCVDLQRFP